MMNKKLLFYYEKYMFVAGSLGHLIFLFQTYTVLITKSSKDVSLFGFVISSFSTISWFLYGLLIKDKILITVNAFGSLASLICILTIIVMR